MAIFLPIWIAVTLLGTAFLGFLLEVWWVFGNAAALLAILLFGLLLQYQSWKNRGRSNLANRSARQLRRIAAAYQQRITGRAGNTWGRVFVFGIYVLFVGSLLAFLYHYFLGRLGFNMLLPFELALWVGAWGVIVLLTIPLFLVSVPQMAYVIAKNMFSGRAHVFAPGLNIKYPWEWYHKGPTIETLKEFEDGVSDVISQRIGEVKRQNVRFLTKDGIGAILPNLVGYWSPFLPMGLLNIRVSANDITDAVAEIFESTLFQEVTGRNVAQLRTKKDIDEIEEALVSALGAPHAHQRDVFTHTIEERYAIVVEIAALGAIRFDQDYEEALRARGVLDMMKTDAKDLMDTLKMEGGEAFNNVMAVNKEAVQKQIITLETSEKASAALGSIGGVALAAVAAGLTPKKDGKHDSDPHGGPGH